MNENIVMAESNIVGAEKWHRFNVDLNRPEHKVLRQIGRQTTLKHKCPECGLQDTTTVYWLDWLLPQMTRELFCESCGEWHVMKKVSFYNMKAETWMELMIATGLQPILAETVAQMAEQNSIDLEAKSVYTGNNF